MKMNNFVLCVLISFLALRSLYVVKGCFTIYHGPFYFLVEPQGLDINCTVVEFISCEGCAWHSLSMLHPNLPLHNCCDFVCYNEIRLCVFVLLVASLHN